MALAGRFAVVAFNPGTLVVVAVGDPSRPAIVGTLGLGRQSGAEVEVAWPYAVVAGGAAAVLVDLTDPALPVVIDQI